MTIFFRMAVRVWRCWFRLTLTLPAGFRRPIAGDPPRTAGRRRSGFVFVLDAEHHIAEGGKGETAIQIARASLDGDRRAFIHPARLVTAHVLAAEPNPEPHVARTVAEIGDGHDLRRLAVGDGESGSLASPSRVSSKRSGAVSSAVRSCAAAKPGSVGRKVLLPCHRALLRAIRIVHHVDGIESRIPAPGQVRLLEPQPVHAGPVGMLKVERHAEHAAEHGVRRPAARGSRFLPGGAGTNVAGERRGAEHVHCAARRQGLLEMAPVGMACVTDVHGNRPLQKAFSPQEKRFRMRRLGSRGANGVGHLR